MFAERIVQPQSQHERTRLLATTEPFLLLYAGTSGGALSVDRPQDADWSD